MVTIRTLKKPLPLQDTTVATLFKEWGVLHTLYRKGNPLNNIRESYQQAVAVNINHTKKGTVIVSVYGTDKLADNVAVAHLLRFENAGGGQEYEIAQITTDYYAVNEITVKRWLVGTCSASIYQATDRRGLVVTLPAPPEEFDIEWSKVNDFANNIGVTQRR